MAAVQGNDIADKVLEMGAHFAPEFSGQQGVEGLDEEIFDLGENLYERQQAVEQQRLEYLERMLAAEEDPRVIQDIEIMIRATRDSIESNRINYERVVPYGNIVGIVFFGLNGLLAQGLLPPEILDASVDTSFIAPRLAE